jgi:hypothetical protein
MKKTTYFFTLMTFFVFAFNFASATDSKHRLYGNQDFDFSASASCAPKESKTFDKFEKIANQLEENNPLIININGKSCLINDKNKSSVAALLEEMSKQTSSQSDTSELKKAFPKKEISAYVDSKNLEKCDKEIESWVIASFAKKSIQPYDIAGIGIRHLSEIKLLIFGGGFVAGLAGDHIGASCMSVIGAGVSYACDKGWLVDK